ncbi:hypothetical protein KP509_10G028500 [Ceratopteris richardii]|uniref:VTT domain-containing protein n=1 Tax=Ceratopteris richardii TaxID=49495 RepID=A0A8T2TZG7_CERRI|nr:hypothetical protein KP509_10G028500 [Ceratopteris richardii]
MAFSLPTSVTCRKVPWSGNCQAPRSYAVSKLSQCHSLQKSFAFSYDNALQLRFSHSRHMQFNLCAENQPSADSWTEEMNEDMLKMNNDQTTNKNWLLKLLILAVIMAAIFTITGALQPQTSNVMSSTIPVNAGHYYKIRLFKRDLLIGERSPGWVYFWLLMAAGFGLFVSEEALNVWVGATLARILNFQSWIEFINSLSINGPYICSTMFWVYWGVCISDMIPFYAGRFTSQTKAGDAIKKKLGVNEEKLSTISRTVQRYGNLIGFVERFSLGVRNPTAFVAGAMGVPPEKYFSGVCVGALITMPLQMGLGCILREHPVKALAGVAAAMAAWTVFPYVAAAVASIAFVIWNKLRQQHHQPPAPSNEGNNQEVA